MVWSHLLPKKSLLVGGEWVGGRPNLVYSPGQSLCPLSLDLLDLTWDLTWVLTWT